jgi:tetratricopeptide (TPR) repeat protein
LLEALRAGIEEQLAVLDDASVTGTGQSSSDLLGVTGTVLAEKLTADLLREIFVRGAQGGAPSPLASQLNHDATHLQIQRQGGVIEQGVAALLDVLVRIGGALSGAVAPKALSQLPPLVTGFTGRDGDLAQLVELLDPAGPAASAVSVVVVVGMAGVGKTALAVQAGHAARRRGWCDGGTAFIDLHGYDDEPVEPGQALDALLRAMGVPGERIPPSPEERAGLYRSVLADAAGTVLVIADNASSEAQVRPLLPGSGQHKLIVTSRYTLAGLGARLVDLTVLDDDASVELLEVAVRAARPGDERIRGDREAAGLLAGLCGGLPLALQIIAALVIGDPTLSPHELAQELATETERLEQLRYDDGAGPGQQSVAAAFELSYRRLGEVSSRVFRLMSANPGPDTSTAAAAVLADLPAGKARRILAELARAHVVEAAPGAAGRWQMHDLLRLYALQLSRENAEADGREQGIDRLLGYYLIKAHAAEQHLREQPHEPVPEEFADRASALEWLDAERATLVAAAGMAAATGRDQLAALLPLVLAEYLQLRRRLDDWLAVTGVSVGAARRLGDSSMESSALVTMGNVLRQLRRFGEAVAVCREAVSIARKNGNQYVEAGALNNLANALHETGKFGEAIAAQRENLAICRATSDRYGEGKALNNLGLTLRREGRLGEAIAAHRQAADLYREVGDSYGAGTALNNLGIALQQAKRLDEAITAYQEDLAICRENTDRYGEATTLNNLGAVLQDKGQMAEAAASHEDAAAIYREIGDRHGEGRALNNLGAALAELGQFEEAIAALQAAAAIFKETGDRHIEGRATARLGLVLARIRRYADAATASRQAAAIFRETGDHDSESAALGNLDAIRAAQRA